MLLTRKKLCYRMHRLFRAIVKFCSTDRLLTDFILNRYFILLIITDGIITDMERTKQAIVRVCSAFVFSHGYVRVLCNSLFLCCSFFKFITVNNSNFSIVLVCLHKISLMLILLVFIAFYLVLAAFCCSLCTIYHLVYLDFKSAVFKSGYQILV